MRTRIDLDTKPVRVPTQKAARVIPIRPRPLPDPKITFVVTNHVMQKADDGESIVVFHGGPGHLVSLPTPGRGSVVLLTHFADVTVLGNGSTIGREETRLSLGAQAVVRLSWSKDDACWYLEGVSPRADRELFLLPLPLCREASDP